MSDFPDALLKDAVPRADANTAGIKAPLNMIYGRPANAQVRPKAGKKPAAKAQPAPEPQRAGSQRGRSVTGRDMLAQAEALSGGKVKSFKGESPFLSGDHVPESSAVGDAEFDPFDVDSVNAVVASNLGSLDELEARVMAQPAKTRSYAARVVDPEPAAQEVPQAEAYLTQKCSRILLEVADGTFGLPVIGVKESSLSILVLLPLREDASMFIPKPGTRMTVTYRNVTHKVYFPGTYAEVEELGIGVMSLIKADEEKQDANDKK